MYRLKEIIEATGQFLWVETNNQTPLKYGHWLSRSESQQDRYNFKVGDKAVLTYQKGASYGRWIVLRPA